MKAVKVKARKNFTALLSLAFLITVVGLSVWSIGIPGTKIGLRGKAASPTQITISPTKIGRNDIYTVKVYVNGSPYNGLLDYDLTNCDLKITSCPTKQGAWGNFTVINGVVTIPSNLNFPEGYYLMRLKPRGLAVTMYSNFDLLVVDDSAVYPGFTLDPNRKTIPMPPRGSYSILKNTDSSGNFLGYTRISVETTTDTTLCWGDVWRYTKTSNRAYWNPSEGDVSVLRWCVNETSGLVRALSGQIYYFDPVAELKNVTVLYPYGDLQYKSAQALLGGFTGNKANPPWSSHADSDMPYHYLLYPFNRILPANLSETVPITMVDTAIGHPMDGKDTSMDIWHVDMLKPPQILNSLVTFRQVENGFADRFASKKWILTEDWTFNSSGLFTQIRQWWDTENRCWDPDYRKCTVGNNKVNATLVESYIPSSDPLTIKFKAYPPLTGDNGTTSLTIRNGASYELIVRQKNGSPYSGFLELEIANPNGSKTRTLWRDKNRRPIYVSSGSVVVPPAAYGSLTNYTATYSVRPYLDNLSLNGLLQTPDWGPIQSPNNSSAAFSNLVTIKIL